MCEFQFSVLDQYVGCLDKGVAEKKITTWWKHGYSCRDISTYLANEVLVWPGVNKMWMKQSFTSVMN